MAPPDTMARRLNNSRLGRTCRNDGVGCSSRLTTRPAASSRVRSFTQRTKTKSLACFAVSDNEKGRGSEREREREREELSNAAGAEEEEEEVTQQFADFTYYQDEDEDFLPEEEREPVYLVGVEFVAPTLEYMSNTSADSAKAVRDLISSGESLKELERLANAAGLRVVGSNRQKLDKPRPATLIGKGKAFQIRDEARQLGATTVFFDCELSPSQAKNLDKILNKKMPVESTRTYSTGSVSIGGGNFGIDFESTSNLEEGGESLFPSFLDSFDGDYDDYEMEEEEEQQRQEEDCIELEKITVGDRTALILDIFSQRAATREGKLQVEMAQAQYQIPRLTRMWTHLERQSGGGGSSGSLSSRGMGEKQIEVDKRLLRKRISLIKRELENVRSQREQFRLKRARANVPVVALVGYTNAGKSSLLNQLSSTFETPGQNNKKLVKARDQLFATLDPTTRRVKLPSGKRLLVSDTVGFVQQLPSALIAAFRATLEEIGSADLLIHVVDVSSPFAYAHVDAVEATLKEIPGASDVPVIHAWNKIDSAAQPELVRAAALDRWPNTVCISAATGEGIEELLNAIEICIVSSDNMVNIDLTLPYERGDLLDLIHSQGVMEEVKYLPEGTRVSAAIPAAYMEKFSEFTES